MPNDFILYFAGGVRISVAVSPRAKISRVKGRYGDAIKISIAAPPEDGKANAELIDLLAKALKLPKRAIQIVGGLSSTKKTIEITTTQPQAIAQALEKLVL